MDAFKTLTSRTINLPRRDIDTDQIVPARFLTTTTRDGLAQAAFHDWRFNADGSAKADNPFADIDLADHQIIVAGDNFGCGSSREHAPWALQALGLRVVISTSIADIFKSNALKNGVVVIDVPQDVHAQLMAQPGTEMTVDLEAEEIRFGNHVVAFGTEPFARRCLLEGKDPLGVLTSAIPEIEAFEQRMDR